MNDGYMDAAAVPGPDGRKSGDTLREQLIDAILDTNHNGLQCGEGADGRNPTPIPEVADALLPLIRAHIAAAEQAERELVRVSPENNAAIVDQVARAIHDSAQQDEPKWTDWDQRSEQIRDHWRPYARAALAAMNARAAQAGGTP